MAAIVLHGMLPKGGVHDIRGMLRNDEIRVIDRCDGRGAEWGIGGGRDPREIIRKEPNSISFRGSIQVTLRYLPAIRLGVNRRDPGDWLVP